MSDTYHLIFLQPTQIDLTKRSSEGNLIGSYVMGLESVYEALEMYHEYLLKQPINASLKNNSASF